MSDKKNGSGKNPWGNNPNKDRTPPKRPTGGYRPSGNYGGGEPPDLDAMLRRAKSDFGSMFPGNMGGGMIGVIAGAVLLVLFVTLCTYIVKPGEHAVIQRFGAWDRTKVDEGLSFKFPWPVETVSKVTVNEIRKMNIGFYEGYGRSANQIQDVPEESLMLTSDRNIVDIDLVIQWNIKSAEDYLFNINDQEGTIKKVAESAIREEIGQTNMFPIITTERDLVAQRTKDIIQSNLDEYNSGVNITQVLIQRAEVHPDVQQAFQDVQSAKQDAEDVQNRARAYREDIIPKARGTAIQMVQDAQAYKESKVAQATGDAERFNSVYESYLGGQDVTKKRIYIETMEQVLGNAQKIIMDTDGGKNGVVPYLPLNELKPAAGASTNRSSQ
ncbi:MAG TPA: FtsH protease activity modulator HflK [Alphaproteobacteria bacterium]|nr:FtsH protease activity modulator HflK [Alphaproteobacteria bacterium]